MNVTTIARAFALVGIFALLISSGWSSSGAQAIEQGTITVTKTWATGQEPNEVVEVCFSVSADEAGNEILAESCTSDETYSVTFGPTAPDLQTGVTYYVRELVGPLWEVTGDNPVAVSIPDTTGEAFVTFENRRIDGAYLDVYEYVCPPGFESDDVEDYVEACQSNPRPGVAMSASGPGDRFSEATTDQLGNIVFAGYTEAGEVTIAESELTGDFAGYVVGCHRVDTQEVVPTEDRGNGRAAFALDLGAEIVDGDLGVRCNWYNIPPAPSADTASLTIHKSACPADVAAGDRFEQCHPNGLEGIDFVLQGPVDREGTTEGDLGAVQWDELPAGVYTVAEAVPSGDFIDYAVFCSRTDSDEEVLFEKRGNGRAAIKVEVGVGAHVVCDWYNIAAVTEPTPVSPASLAIEPTRGPDRQSISYEGAGYTPGGAVVVLMTGDGLIVDETRADGDGRISGSFTAPNRDQLTGESTNDIPVFAIDEATGRESERATFTYVTALPTSTPTPSPTLTPTLSLTPVIGRPVHIHHGSCERLDDAPRFDLTDLTTPEAPALREDAATVSEASFTVVDVSLEELLADDFAINAHPSHKELRPFVACGEIGGPQRDDGSVVIGLREQNGSGLTGIAYLRPDPNDPDRTQVTVFLAPGQAEEDPTLQVPAGGGDAVVIRSVRTNGPLPPEYQSSVEITITADGRAEIVIVPEGASPALPENERTAEVETRTVELSEDEFHVLLLELDAIGFFDLPQPDAMDPGNLIVGGPVSLLTVTLIDGTWEVDGNGLSANDAAVLNEARRLVADAVGTAFDPE